MGWPMDETDRTLGPVLDRMKQQQQLEEGADGSNGTAAGAGARGRQTRLDQFYLAYHNNTRFAKIRSSRLEEAVRTRIGKEKAKTPQQ